MEFFRHSAGKWRSQRATHHLAFRRAETGGSEIYVESLSADNPKIIEICQLHQVDPATSVGGAFVSWDGSMAWDKEDESHEGTTIFALIPDADNPQQGMLLRDRGYAETAPVAGRYLMDEDDALVLTTEYETMSSIERFWFASPNLRLRTSTVLWFGGANKTTFCIETRIAEAEGNNRANSPVVASSSNYAISGW
jgi:hypothetical protein